MADLWLRDVIKMPGKKDGGSMVGGPPRFVWHTFEAPYSMTAKQGANYLIAHGLEVHFTFNPITGEVVQLIPANRAARGLRNLSGGVQTNRQGSVNLQVEVMAKAARPFTKDLTTDGKAGLARLVNFARAHGIPDVWPAGAPPKYPGGSSSRSATTWVNKAGHYGHSQVPENDHGDPGALDIAVLFKTPAPKPKPKPEPQSLEDDMVVFVSPEGRQPGDGIYAVTGEGVFPVSAARWKVLYAAGARNKDIPRADYNALLAELAT